MTYKKATRYAQTSDEDSPNNFLYSFPPFAFARNDVTYNIGGLPSSTYQTYSELDRIGFTASCLTRENHKGEMGFFEFLLSNGIKSKLTDHFIDCERKNKNYTLPTNDKVVIVKVLVQEKGKVNNKKGAVKRTFPALRVCGFENIKQLGLLDPLFYLNLFLASEKGLCEITAVDIFVDFGQNLIKYLLLPVLDGKLQSFGDGQIKIYGKVGDKTYNGDPIGPQSSAYKAIRQLDLVTKSLSTIQTIYLGSSKYSPHNIIIYDKEVQQANKSQKQTAVASRIEIRLSTRTNSFYKDILPWLLLSIITPTGAIYRQIVFFVVLFTFSRVTTIQQLKNVNSNFLALTHWSSWWMRLLELTVHMISPVTSFETPQKAQWVLDNYGQYLETVLNIWKNDKSSEKLADCIKDFYLTCCNDLLLEGRLFRCEYNAPCFGARPNHLPQAFSLYDIRTNAGSGDEHDLLHTSLIFNKLAINFPFQLDDIFVSKESFLNYQKQPPTQQIAYKVIEYCSVFVVNCDYDSRLIANQVENFNQEQVTYQSNYELLMDLVLNVGFLADFINAGEFQDIEKTKALILSENSAPLSFDLDHWLFILTYANDEEFIEFVDDVSPESSVELSTSIEQENVIVINPLTQVALQTADQTQVALQTADQTQAAKQSLNQEAFEVPEQNERQEVLELPQEQPLKRGRGRPRKTLKEPIKPKGKRGRPRKVKE